jgi:hypothetical protein
VLASSNIGMCFGHSHRTNRLGKMTIHEKKIYVALQPIVLLSAQNTWSTFSSCITVAVLCGWDGG